MIHFEQDKKLVKEELQILQESTSPTVIHIFGAGGWLGSHLHSAFRSRYGASNVEILGSVEHDDVEFESLGALTVVYYYCKIDSDAFAYVDTVNTMLKNRIGEDITPRVIVINAVAKTNTRWCELHPEETYHSNVECTKMLYEKFSTCDMFLQISTGCIYEGNSFAWDEYDIPNPQIIYSKSKAEAEKFLKDKKNVVIVRPRMPFHENDKGNNILYKAKKFSHCLAEPNSMVYMTDIVMSILRIINRNGSGIYNVVNTGSSSPFYIAQYLWERHDIVKISKEDLFSKEHIYLTNTLLKNDRIKTLYPEMPDINSRLAQVKEYLHSKMIHTWE